MIRETHDDEMIGHVVRAGQNAIKAAFILNGTAAFAILALLSHLAINSQESAKVLLFAYSHLG